MSHAVDSPAPRAAARARRMSLWIAFAAVYLIWGSTYLGIRVAIDSIPTFLMAGMRLASAGALLLVWARWRGAAWPSAREWGSAALIGTMLLGVGNGTVTWSEQRVPSGLVALLVATVPIWMATLSGLGAGGPRPRATTWIGVALGVCGIALLVGPGTLRGGQRIDPVAAAALGLSSLSWAWGSLLARRVPLPKSPLMATAAEMLVGGVVLTLASGARGEFSNFSFRAVTPVSWLAFAYLVTFGSIVAFTAYVWLLRTSSPARVSTYAFVNPVVAVALGWAFLGEALTGRTVLAAAVIVSAVAIIVASRATGAERPARADVTGSADRSAAPHAAARILSLPPRLAVVRDTRLAPGVRPTAPAEAVGRPGVSE